MGDSHLEDNEILEYETSARADEDQSTLLTDDESDDDDYERIWPLSPINGDGPIISNHVNNNNNNDSNISSRRRQWSSCGARTELER